MLRAPVKFEQTKNMLRARFKRAQNLADPELRFWFMRTSLQNGELVESGRSQNTATRRITHVPTRKMRNSQNDLLAEKKPFNHLNM